MQLIFICATLLSIFAVGSIAVKNNVCRTFWGYNFKSFGPSKCYHDPDADTDQPDKLILNHAPKVESYNVTTDDGYILTVYRIPRENPLGVVWLGHPVLVDGMIWISQGNDSLAFLAWEAGYDVWLPSNRGTTLSPGHLSLTVNDYKYWNFSFHEIGTYDYPAIADLIYKNTGGLPITFVGHSTGSASALIYASLLPNHASNRVKLFINMATPANFKYIPLYLKICSRAEVLLKIALKLMRVGGILKYHDWYVDFFRFGNKFYPFNKFIMYFFTLTAGWTPKESEPDQWALSLPKTTRGQSAKILTHYAQLAIAETSFQQYDYGKKENNKRYGQDKPPKYPLGNITVPFYFVCANKDNYATVKDNEAIYSSLPKKYQKGKHVVTGLNHLDYYIGKSRKAKVYDHVLSVISENA